MKINFNRDNITKYLIIGGVAALTLVTGVKFSSDAKKNSKAVDINDNKKYEMQYAVEDSNIASSNNVYCAKKGYHVEGTWAVKDNYSLENRTDQNNLTIDSVTYSAPVGYTLEVRDDIVLAVRTVVKKDIKPLDTEEFDGNTVYVAPVGYYLDGDKAIKETVVTEEIPATKVLTK